MKLSLCIPVYNFDVRNLVKTLHREIKTKNLVVEIIVIDDASNSTFVEINKEIQNLTNQFIFLKNNIGRSSIRNLFLNYITGDYMLFLDCDSQVNNENFLEEYIHYVEQHPKTLVLYGGREIGEEHIDQNRRLRWKFARERENLTLDKRVMNPWKSFQTNNFLIKKEILIKHPFFEQLKNYGYEDFIFAHTLKQENIIINHFANPVLNADIETNTVYLKKVEQSIENLASLLITDYNLIQEIKLITAYKLLEKFGLQKFGLYVFSKLRYHIRKRLETGKASLYLLDFYKLGLLLVTVQRTKKWAVQDSNQ